MISTLKFIYVLTLILTSSAILAQTNLTKTDIYVDKNGVMRWENSGKEVKGFGVNYTVPFAHAYRTAKKMSVDIKDEIDGDVYHFSRLGFDLYRLHVWDTQISDSLGNLIENEYLNTFDYLLYRLKEKNINYVITPIAYWGDGWPEPDSETPGFSNKYGKNECLTNPDAVKAQQNYLYQFLNHINPYTGIAYKDEPNILAFEVSNEPHHRGDAESVTKFVKGMTEAMRKTGTKKPIFYNVSHAVHLMDAYFKGNIQGGTFQWYPTGLGYKHELSGNLLPNVNSYSIPFEETIKKYKGAKLVYEFDAADVGRSYIYPAMARSFREAGIQIATHFAYDPTYMGQSNTEYNTHYMNLIYTPQKALSLMICSEIFHEIPMYKDFGTYPENNSFDDFKVDYSQDLAEYNSEKKFIYTNSNGTSPKNRNKLESIAGYGNSVVAKYDGQGAYFLDRVDKGVWRLEVLPDAIWVNNPFGRNSPKKTIGIVVRKEHKMTLNIIDLGENITVETINEGNNYNSIVENNSFSIKPGTYIISKKGSNKNWSTTDDFGVNKLNDFFAPESNVDKLWLRHDPPEEVTESTDLKISVQIVDFEEPEKVIVAFFMGPIKNSIEMLRTNGYNYTATISAENINVGYLNYNIIVQSGGNKFITYPAEKAGRPFEWDFYDRKTYKIRIVKASNPINLFEAIDDSDLLVRQWRNTFKLIPTDNYGEAEYQMNIEELFVRDNENRFAKPVYDYSFKHFVLDRIQERMGDLPAKGNIVFYGRALNDKNCKLQIALVMSDGSAYGDVIEIGQELKHYYIPLKNLKPVRTVTLPRPYPTFLPYYLEHNINRSFDISKVESIQFSIGPEIPMNQIKDKHGVGIVNLRLE